MPITTDFLSGTGQQIGGVTAEQRAEVQARLAQIAANIEARRAAEAAAGAAAAGNGNGNGAGPGPFGLSGTIPNNFWGYLMLVVGMR